MYYSNEAFSDHSLIMFNVNDSIEIHPTAISHKRSWFKYSSQLLREELSKVNWQCDRQDTQSYYNWLENELLKVIDDIIPYKQLKIKQNPYSENEKTKRLINKKRFLIKRWKKYKRLPDKINANKLNLEIRKLLYETKKSSVRQKIKPGNSKTLWDATKIAMDKECMSRNWGVTGKVVLTLLLMEQDL